jgi:uncharacterized membrane protein YbhN (UPF0104 family)
MLHKHSWDEFYTALTAIPLNHIFSAFAFTGLSYLALAGYDFSAIRYIRCKVGSGRVFLASFIGFAFSQNLGLSPLTGGSVRLRLYTAAGLTPMEVAKIVAFCILTFSIGSTAICGLVLMLMPETLRALDGLPVLASQIVGGATFFAVIAYLIWVSYRKLPITFKGFEFQPPSALLSLWQVFIAALDVACAAAVFYVLLPDSHVLHFYYFFGIYIVAYTLGILSHVPGGLGVFEIIVITLLGNKIPETAIIGALLLFRIIYLFVPLILATVSFIAFEAWEKKKSRKAIPPA